MSREKKIESQGFVDTSGQRVEQLLFFVLREWQVFLLFFLFMSVVFVSIKTVVQRHESRLAYMELQTHEKERDRLAARWSRLKLEQATTLNQVRVEQYARWDLGMKMPKTSEVRIIQEQEDANFLAVGQSMELNVSTGKFLNTSEVGMDN